MTRTCTRPGCEQKHLARGLCRRHYRANQYRQSAYGRWEPFQRVPTTQARQRVQELLDAGLTQATIADLSGLNTRTIAGLLNGEYDTVFESTVRALNAVRLPPLERLNPQALIANIGTARRLQALAAIGWEAGKIRAELGWAQPQLTRIRSGTQRQVTVAVAIQVRDLYTRLHLIDGGGGLKSRRYAIRAGWALPLEWDDIDNPDETPSGRRELFGQQKAKTLDRREQVAKWMDDPRPEWHKGTAMQLAERLGCTDRTIERDKAHIRTQRAKEEDAA